MADTNSVTVISPSHPPSSAASESMSDSQEIKTKEVSPTSTSPTIATTFTTTTSSTTTTLITSTSSEAAPTPTPTPPTPTVITPPTASTTPTPPTPTSTTIPSPVLPSPASSTRRVGGGLGGGVPARKTPITNALNRKGTSSRQGSVGSLARGPVKIGKTKTAKKKALLVDDITVTAHLVVNGLHRAGYEADTAKDGRAAVDSAKKNQYDVILMDVKLPLMDGVEATRLIRQHEKENDLPPCLIFGLTAATSSDELKSYEVAGMDGCIEKGCVVPVAVAHAVATKKADPSQKFIFIDPKTEITQDTASSSKMRTTSSTSLSGEAAPTTTTGTRDVVDKE